MAFVYPMTGVPGRDLPGGEATWNAIPGARGCTPQACSFRDAIGEFDALGARVVGVSLQDSASQREAAARLGLPYLLLSDEDRTLTRALGLPTFEVHGETFLRRLTMFIRDGRIVDIIYPVFPPDQSAAAARARLAAFSPVNHSR